MKFSHILITRPQQEAMELLELLASVPAEILVLPAYQFVANSIYPDQLNHLSTVEEQVAPLLVFTSPRSVEYGLKQMPAAVIQAATVAAIGPATGRLLEQMGVEVNILPRQGYNSEDLLEELKLRAASAPLRKKNAAGKAGLPGDEAFILAAPGGRTTLKEGLQDLGYQVHSLMVYERRPAKLDPEVVSALENADAILSIWTSANSMNSLSQRLPTAAWYRMCRGEWLVISDRLLRVARAYSPAKIHVANGPGNAEIATSVQSYF